MFCLLISTFKTRSGTSFASWDATSHVTSANPEFDFNGLVLASLARAGASLDGASDVDNGDDPCGLSPLTTPDPSPSTSPSAHAVDLPPASPTSPSFFPSTAPPPPTSSTELDPPPSPANKTTKFNREKKRGHRNRAKKRKRQLHEDPAQYETRPSTKAKYVRGSIPTTTGFDSRTIAIAGTGYVSSKLPKSEKTYRLDELVGEASKFGFKLISWDGR